MWEKKSKNTIVGLFSHEPSHLGEIYKDPFIVLTAKKEKDNEGITYEMLVKNSCSPIIMVKKDWFAAIMIGNKIVSRQNVKGKKLYFDKNIVLGQYSRSPRTYLLIAKQPR